MSSLRIFTIIFMFIILLSYLPSKTLAQEVNIVQPAILVPRGYDISVKEQQYKESIIQALIELQQFFGNKLEGHYFQFNPDPNSVEVIKVNKYLPNTNDTEIMFFSLGGGRDVLVNKEGVVYSVWIIGANNPSYLRSGGKYDFDSRGNKVSYSDPRIKHGIALLLQYDLDQLAFNDSLSQDRYARRLSLGFVTHELGHAFGLTFGEHARGHPCTTISRGNCTNVSSPPSADEWTGSIMGDNVNRSDGGITGFPLINRQGFNNSKYNHEKWTLYQSPFIYPNNDTPPEPEGFDKNRTLSSVNRTLSQTDIADVQAPAGDSQFGSSGERYRQFQIESNRDVFIKKIVFKKIKANNNEEETFTEMDNLISSFIRLPVIEGKSEFFQVAAYVTYRDGSTQRYLFGVNYEPPATAAIPTPSVSLRTNLDGTCPGSCGTDSRGGLEACEGGYWEWIKGPKDQNDRWPTCPNEKAYCYVCTGKSAQTLTPITTPTQTPFRSLTAPTAIIESSCAPGIQSICSDNDYGNAKTADGQPTNATKVLSIPCSNGSWKYGNNTQWDAACPGGISSYCYICN